MTSSRPAPPTVDLVRRTTDRRIAEALVDGGSLTRPELSRITGVSKPTASQSILRMTQRGLIREDGIERGGPGRNGVRYRLSDDLGVGMAVYAGPHHVVAEAVDIRGQIRARSERPVGLMVTPRQLSAALRPVLRECADEAPGPILAKVVAVADPVRRNGHTLALAGSPFLTAPADLRRTVGADAVIGNDVNWAALAELTDGGSSGPASFLYVYLGAGLGAAIVDGGRVITGGDGLAGEIAYVATTGPRGRSRSLLQSFQDLDLCVPGQTTIDVDKVLRVLARQGRDAQALITALGAVLGSAICLVSPSRVIVGGPWAAAPGLIGRLAAAAEEVVPYPVAVTLATVIDSPPLAGARIAATAAVRDALHRSLA